MQITTQTPSMQLNFSHPVKELIWCSKNTGTAGRNETKTQTLCGRLLQDLQPDLFSLDAMGGNWQLKLNGHDRFKERDTKYSVILRIDNAQLVGTSLVLEDIVDTTVNNAVDGSTNT